ncbi:nucleoside triphosphate hydrolase superfamily protein [Rippkaea orientalis PCC 8801]|uniref:Nucleoside triphosphate hydrolase superfamily protein n=1 Tax=Rippkaea orientalis (strain PCC 8801 / RF-1) TaxID=41431 RepID=B7K316_RIPO1|nr:sulfotransferase [Rippkaea orientalis]ACK67717.1 nucleoside triphosphate hydrolase superfamily protein [Rippkaea orientalis PCC 8801]
MQIPTFDKSLRNLKDDLARNYYKIRLNDERSPYHIRFRKRPYKVLFILSHMRSGSSLLTHILNSHPDIIGYGETHLNYSREMDFKQLLFKVYWQLREYSMSHHYVLDKVLHNHKFLTDNFLFNQQVYSIFLLREPNRTLSSILDIKPHWTQEKATNYYLERLAMLENYAKLISNQERSLFITYNQLIKQSDLVFNTFKEFLQTETGFSEQYQVLKTTGIKGVGDSSENIHKGKIMRNARELKTTVSPELIMQGQKSFERCCETLSHYCLHLP